MFVSLENRCVKNVESADGICYHAFKLYDHCIDLGTAVLREFKLGREATTSRTQK